MSGEWRHPASVFVRPPTIGVRPLLAVAVLIAFALLLTACSAPTRAPVISRDLAHKRPAADDKSRPAYHRVKKGDTLYSIAWEYALDQDNLATWNRISAPFTIYPGQKLRLSAPAQAISRPKQRPLPDADIAGKKRPAATATDDKAVSSKPSASASAKALGTNTDAQTAHEKVKLTWTWPTKGAVNQGFSPNDPARKGVKIAGRLGQNVVAAEAGRVVYAGSGLIGYGRLIIIKHNKNYLSAYGYNRAILVKEGDQVSRGAKIAEMGNGSSGGAQLHFEIRRNGTPVDPLKLLPRG